MDKREIDIDLTVDLLFRSSDSSNYELSYFPAWETVRTSNADDLALIVDKAMILAEEMYALHAKQPEKKILGVLHYKSASIDKVLAKIIGTHREYTPQLHSLINFIENNSLASEDFVKALLRVKHLHPDFAITLARIAGSILSVGYIDKGGITSKEEGEAYLEELFVQLDYDISEKDFLALPEYDKALKHLLTVRHFLDETLLQKLIEDCSYCLRMSELMDNE